MSANNLDGVRTHIDELDVQIQELITQRAKLAEKVSHAKHATEKEPVLYRPEREAEVLRKVSARDRGPLSEKAINGIFREIMSACLAVQKPLRVAFLGPEGTYSQTAVLKHFGRCVHTLATQTIEDVFREVEAGNADYGVAPAENSSEGGVNHTLNMFICSPLLICGEVELEIHQYLLSHADTLQKIKRIYSHRQSFGQCRSWLNTQLSGIEQIAVNSNAEAAQRAAAEPDAAAIAGESTAEIYGLRILAARIEDELDNTTRFVVLGRQSVQPTSRDKTSIVVSGPNQSGALYQLLGPIAENKLNMTRIESHPSRRGIWAYVFFIDIEGHADDPVIAKAMGEIKAQSAMFKHLGSYPAA
ncbi:MAG: prephenate dehydratase [Gammaproteobacteria bacterium]|nr:prephenate dehydratase [Gammaproteobacteria bacterium]